MDVTTPQDPANWQQPKSQPPQQPYQQPQPQIIYTRPLPTSRHAVASLVTGIVGAIAPLCLFLAAPYLLGAISTAAVITGHLALDEMKDSKGMLRGRGMAITGLILGYPVMFLWVFVMMSMVIHEYS
jgi:hypothetical protein